MIYPTLLLKASKITKLYLLSFLLVLVISGCDGRGHDPGEKNADAAKGRDSQHEQGSYTQTGRFLETHILPQSRTQADRRLTPSERMPREGSSMNRMGVWRYNS